MSKLEPISAENPLILASASPRRAELLGRAGIAFDVRPTHIDEDALPDEDARAHASRLACEKARAALERLDAPAWVLAADTIVLLGDRVLGKPGDEAGARAMLTDLSGRDHSVITAFCIATPADGRLEARMRETRVRMKKVADGDVAAYVATGEPMDKAGGYGIQGIGAFLVEGIEGSYANVVGLPIEAVIDALRARGALARYP